MYKSCLNTTALPWRNPEPSMQLQQAMCGDSQES